jgi:hypothetical protein
MKRRIRKTLNFFAFNILFFAIYLNFIQKEKPDPALQTNVVKSSSTTVVSDAPAQPKVETVNGNINY